MIIKNRIDQALNTSFGDLQVDLENIVEHLFGDKKRSACNTAECRWAPRTDVVESDSDYKIELDLPGLAAEDVNVEVKEGRLEISGERAKRNVAEGTKVLRSERAVGKFVRSFEFSVAIDADKIAAEFKHGVLQLTVPKSEKELPRKIEIKVAE